MSMKYILFVDVELLAEVSGKLHLAEEVALILQENNQNYNNINLKILFNITNDSKLKFHFISS